jgi:hypothetical protein
MQSDFIGVETYEDYLARYEQNPSGRKRLSREEWATVQWNLIDAQAEMIKAAVEYRDDLEGRGVPEAEIKRRCKLLKRTRQILIGSQAGAKRGEANEQR